MRLREIDYTKVQSVRKRCIHYAKDGNTVVKHWRNLFPLEVITGRREFTGLFLEYKKEGWSELFRVYNDLGADCVEYGYLSGWYDDKEETVEHLKKSEPYIGLEGYKLWLAQKEQRGAWINNAMIRGLTDAGELDLAEHCQQNHDRQVEEQEKEDRARQAKRDRQRQLEEQERQAELEKQVLDAEKCILERRELVNEPYDGSTIILHLMKKL